MCKIRRHASSALAYDRSAHQDHAVVAVRDHDHWLIMDNRFTTLTEDSGARSLTPFFALSDRGVQLFATPFLKNINNDISIGAPINDPAETGSQRQQSNLGPAIGIKPVWANAQR